MTQARDLDPPKREPSAAPARIAPLANLPLFHRLAGRKAVVAGGSDGAVWKAELLAAAGAEVLVLAGEASEKFAAIPALTVFPRGWTPADLEGAALAVGDPGSREEALGFVAAARAAGAAVNVIDQTDLCDVQFGTIVNRSPVVVAISTGGAAPMLGQSIRARIEAVLPLGLSAWAKAASTLRPRLKARVKSFADRRAFWESFVERAWGGGEPDGSEALLDCRPRREGRVTLVGAGPGDPELLTLKAVRALQSATTILYDDLVGPEILELARRESKRVAVGKTGRGPSCRQSDINARMVSLALAGENVVRLKGGDPLVFGRATEEIDACRAAGVEVTIVPGISAAQGAAAALGFSLTERKEARRIQFVTGHGADGRLPGDIDWAAIADPAATTIVYMPRATLGEFARSAVAAGLSPDTPAVAIASATLPAQAHASGTITTVAGLAGSLPPGAPVTVVIGRVARNRDAVTPAKAGASGSPPVTSRPEVPAFAGMTVCPKLRAAA
ncbi:MAG TPA: siroheme synthase CysG [Allosphingosinicella sp.]|jgi:uroporphyrin-III C-methyltransferase/precorrin-2 dehydrogenase/sirohydrochlorin ferrochelatase